jgi:dTDP-4-amino-4,6-dideoxygalactose transaminase
MPNINAALGCAQMEQLDKILANKRETAMKYKAFFKTIEIVDFFDEPENCKSNFWLNAIVLKDRETRDNFLQYSNDNNVMTRPVWTLMNQLPMFSDYQTDNLTNTRWFEDRVVNIPSSVHL